MAKANKINNKKFVSLVASDMNKKTTRPVDSCIRAIADRLAKEMVRGNEVKIREIGTFRPVMRGGNEINYFGEQRYVEPRLVMTLEISPIMFEKLNGMVLNETQRVRLRNDKAERDDLDWVTQRYRKPIEPIYEKIKHELDINLFPNEEDEDDEDNDEFEDDDE